MPAYKMPRPRFDRVTVQEYIRVFMHHSDTLNAFKVLSVVKPKSPLDIALQTFKDHTDVPLQIPFMGFMHLVSTWLLKNESVLEVQGAILNPDLWTVVLAPSGAGKTFSFNKLEKVSEEVLHVKADFDAVVSAAAYAQELKDKNRSLWFYDEFAQFLGQVEQHGSPLYQCKEYLLKTYDGKLIQRKTKDELIEIEKPVLSILGVNTLESYLNKISEESFTDGFSQRFSYLLAKVDPSRTIKDFTWYHEKNIIDELKKAFTNLSKVTLHKNYSLSQEAFEAYEEGFQRLLIHKVGDSFYRRLMYRSLKYALIFHVINGNNSDIIDAEDMAWAMRLIDVHLADLKELLAHYNYSELAKTIKKVQDKKAEFENANKPFGAREIVQNIKSIRTTVEAKSILQFVNEIEAQDRKANAEEPSGQDPQFKVAA